VPTSANPFYRAEVSRSYRMGVKPGLFSTGNPTSESNQYREMKFHRPGELSWLGKRVLGLVDFDASEEEGEEGEDS